jgi:hypothetical protein
MQARLSASISPDPMMTVLLSVLMICFSMFGLCFAVDVFPIPLHISSCGVLFYFLCSHQ